MFLISASKIWLLNSERFGGLTEKRHSVAFSVSAANIPDKTIPKNGILKGLLKKIFQFLLHPILEYSLESMQLYNWTKRTAVYNHHSTDFEPDLVSLKLLYSDNDDQRIQKNEPKCSEMKPLMGHEYIKYALDLDLSNFRCNRRK